MRIGKLRTNRWAGVAQEHWAIEYGWRTLVHARWGGGLPLAVTFQHEPPRHIVSPSADRHRRGFDCPICDGTGRTVHHDLPDGSSRASQCLVCGGTGRRR